MQLIRSFEQEGAAAVGLGTRVLLVATGGGDSVLKRRLAGLGGQVECQAELFTGLSMLIDDPFGYGLFVVECEAFGGLERVRRACCTLVDQTVRVPVILVSGEIPTQIFPTDRHDPVVLRAPVSAVSLRVGFEHALRDRLALRAS